MLNIGLSDFPLISAKEVESHLKRQGLGLEYSVHSDSQFVIRNAIAEINISEAATVFGTAVATVALALQIYMAYKDLKGKPKAIEAEGGDNEDAVLADCVKRANEHLISVQVQHMCIDNISNIKEGNGCCAARRVVITNKATSNSYCADIRLSGNEVDITFKY